MAANSKSTREIANLGKRVVNHFFARDPTLSVAASSATGTRRAPHTSAYEKNWDDNVNPTIVPDDVIQPQSDKYWAPHPQTGVFGPATEHHGVAGGEGNFQSSPVNGSDNSALEEKAWFRPTSLEDQEKPVHF